MRREEGSGGFWNQFVLMLDLNEIFDIIAQGQ